MINGIYVIGKTLRLRWACEQKNFQPRRSHCSQTQSMSEDNDPGQAFIL